MKNIKCEKDIEVRKSLNKPVSVEEYANIRNMNMHTD